jgi:DUF4097 and DUF4098 domain-containing protein YvlB
LDIILINIIHISRRTLFSALGACLIWILFAFSSSLAAVKGDSIRYQERSNPYMTKEFEISGSGLLKIFTVAGNIEIVPSSSANKVKVELYLDRGFAFWSNTKNLDNFRITMLQRGNEIVASVERKKQETSFFSDQMTFSFRVYVPESMSTELKTLGGNIKLQKVHGNQSIKTSGGNITLADIKGHLQAYTAGGNINISNTSGTIYAITDGGNISLDRNSGEIRLKTNGGRIISERISGTMLAKVGGGDIRADFISVSEGINLETSAGNIQLELPDHVGYELLLRGTEIQFDERDKVHGEVRAGRIEGTYKDGGPPINLSTNAGTITLRIK